MNLHPLNLHARDLKAIINKELLGNGFEKDFIVEAKIDFQFSPPTQYKRTIYCFPYLVDKEGKRYESGRIIEDVYEMYFDVFTEMETLSARKNKFWKKIMNLFK